MLSQNIEGLCFEFHCEPIARSASGDTFDFQFEICLKNDTGSTFEIVSRLVKIRDGNGEQLQQKSTATQKEALRLHPGDKLRFEGRCPLPMPVGSVECELLVKDPEDGISTVCSPRFQMTHTQSLH